MKSNNRRSFLKNTTGAVAGALALPALSQAIQGATSTYQRPRLKITDIRTAEVMVHGWQTHVRVYTDQGLIGQGESTDAAVGTAALVRSFRRLLIGKDPLNVDALWESVRVSGIFAGAQGGQYVTALTGIEIALWDLAGKALNLPIYQLLGGKFRDRVRMYCDSDMEDPMGPEAERKIPWIKSSGFTAMKIDIDQARDPARFDSVNWTASNGEIDRMVTWVRHTRESIPKNMDLAVDMHGRYDATTGKQVAIAVEPYRLLWLEEPVPPKTSTPWPISGIPPRRPFAAAKTYTCAGGFASYSTSGPQDIIMPDLQKVGGLSEGRKVANLAQTYYVPFAPHCVVSPIGTMASGFSVCASVPNFLVCEWHWINHLDLWKSFVKEGEIISEGHITIPDRPGIGVEIDERAARQAQVPDTGWFEPSNKA